MQEARSLFDDRTLMQRGDVDARVARAAAINGTAAVILERL
jgi:hypothetical protein